MTDIDVYTISEVKQGSCKFTKPEKFSGFHKSFITMNGKKGFILQSPKLVLRDSNAVFFDLSISRNKDRHKEFYNIISHIEDTAILSIVTNSEEWFGKKITKDQAESMFKSSLRCPLEINDPFIYRVNKNQGLANIEHSYPVVCLIKFDGIIFGRNSSILDMKVIQIKVIKTEKIPSDEDTNEVSYTEQSEKPFYNDNVSVVPSNFNNEKRPIVTAPSVPSIVEEANELEEKIVELEKKKESMQVPEPMQVLEPVQVPEVTQIPEPVQVPEVTQIPEPVQVQEQVQAQVPEQAELKKYKDSIKYEMMKALVDNDYVQIQKLSNLLGGL
jgi:hypothetical protein